MIQNELFDICWNRHRGNSQSIAANPTLFNKRRDRAKVYEIIQTSTGITSKEIAKQMGRRLNCISGRSSELKHDGLVTIDGRRDGCGVVFEFNPSNDINGTKHI